MELRKLPLVYAETKKEAKSNEIASAVLKGECRLADIDRCLEPPEVEVRLATTRMLCKVFPVSSSRLKIKKSRGGGHPIVAQTAQIGRETATMDVS